MKNLTSEDFLTMSNIVHKNYYDYTVVKYINKSTKVKIKCNIKGHGIFEQTPSNHLLGKGCNKCGLLSATLKRTDTKESFIEKAIKIHNNFYDYSNVEYINSITKIKISCPKHNIFEQLPSGHLSGSGCQKCARELTSSKIRKSLESFVREANEKHNNYFDYSKVIYKNNNTKITIGCPKHGNIQIKPVNHLNQYGCPKCGNENKGGYLREEYINKANGRICTFYIIKCFNQNEEFYKIGITVKTISLRYNTIKLMPYNYEIISENFGDAGFIWDLEKKEIKKLKEFHYLPNIKFSGSKSECFTQYKL